MIVKPIRLLASLLYRAAIPSTLLLLSACAVMRHDSQPTALADPGTMRVAEDIQLSKGEWPSQRWWEAYGDAQLDSLLEQALQQSATMKIARERIAQAQANVDLVHAVSGLQVAALASVDRERISSDGFLGAYAGNDPQIGATGPWYTEGIAGFAASYQIDVWGKHRAEVDAAIGLRQARTMERADTELTISTGVAQLYYEMQAAYQLIDLLNQLQHIASVSTEAYEARAKQGVDAKSQVEVARAKLLGINRQIVVAEAQVVRLREALRALLGAGPDGMVEIRPVALPEIPSALPATLSYELLARRPDLQAMRWYVQASFDKIDAAKAAFYPDFDIKAFFGVDALHLGSLLMRSSQQINLLPGLYLPVFDSGQLNANLAGARTQSNELILRYNQAVLDAVRDVATTGSQLQALDKQLQLQNERVESVKIAWNSVDAHYQRGLLSQVAALEARQDVLIQQIELLDVRAQRIVDDIDLTKELGGGFRVPNAANTLPR